MIEDLRDADRSADMGVDDKDFAPGSARRFLPPPRRGRKVLLRGLLD